MGKIKNILYKILILLIVFSNYILADPPNWDENGDGVLDNYTDYENNGSLTSKVYFDNIDVGNENDMVASFVNGEQRGVAVAEEIPSFLGEGYAFLMMIYSNQTNGEMLTFQYYDSSDDILYYLNETLEFTSNMVEGDVINPFYLSYISNTVDPPNWDEDGDGVLDNYTDYENNGSITAGIIIEESNYGEEGDMIAAFFNGEQRGVGLATIVPFGPYQNTYQFQMMIYSNQTSGEILSFEFYDESAGQIYYLDQNIEFISNMIEGNVMDPYIFTFDVNSSDDIYGCTDFSACNYNSDATYNDGTCEYPPVNYDCEGNCIVDLDCLGICGGSTLIDICGVCDGDNSTCTGCMDILACNYDPDATVDIGCEYPQDNYDCEGVCIADVDCLGICGGTAFLDECGECNGNGIDDGYCDCNNNMLDCSNICAGLAYIDNCGDCVGGNTGINECESFTYHLDLHYGSNLVSFFGLPQDNSISNILANNNNDYIYSILGEMNSSVNLGNNEWQGSINSIDPNSGYWFRTLNSMSLEIPLSYDINDSISYELHSGVNLVSFPSPGIYNLEEAIPDALEDKFLAVFSESLIAVRMDDGTWIGSLDYFEGGNGYWFMVSDDFQFNYNLSEIFLSRNRKNLDILHIQSSIQSFYFINNINSLNLNSGDWILAFKDNVLVGSRKWDGINNDIPVMGNDGNIYSENYPNFNDAINFKILKENTNEYIDLNGDIPTFSNMSFHSIELYSEDLYLDDFIINSCYPNPFNPVISMSFNVNHQDNIEINILDLNGRIIENIVNSQYLPGSHVIEWDADLYSSGIYFFQVITRNHIFTEKITLIK